MVFKSEAVSHNSLKKSKISWKAEKAFILEYDESAPLRYKTF